MRSRFVRLAARLAPLALAIVVGAQSLATAAHVGAPAPAEPAHERHDHDPADCSACLLGAQLRTQLLGGVVWDLRCPESARTRLHERAEAAPAAPDLAFAQSRGPPRSPQA